MDQKSHRPVFGNFVEKLSQFYVSSRAVVAAQKAQTNERRKMGAKREAEMQERQDKTVAQENLRQEGGKKERKRNDK